MAKSLALKLLGVSLGGVVTGVTAMLGAAGDALSGDGASQFVTVFGGGITAAAIGVWLPVIRMFRNGELTSKKMDDREAALSDALSAATVALTASTKAWESMNQAALRREEALDRIVQAYLPEPKGP